MRKLFIYGTLAPGKENHHVLSALSGDWQPATVRGTLVNAGWGAGRGCPGLIPASDG